MKIFISLILSLFMSNTAFAYNYTDNDKNMFYDAFLEGYFTEMQKNINNLDITPQQKENFMTALKENINRQELINSSWSCIEKYPIRQIITASVVCTYDWNNKQALFYKQLYNLMSQQ